MFVPIQPALQHSATFGALPNIWVGSDAPTATGWFSRAGLGSTYIRKVSATDIRTYTKVRNTPAATDWVVVGSSASAGFVPVPLANVRELATGSFLNAVGLGGLLSSDSTPILNTINGDTDGAWRISWAGGNSDLVGFQVTLPSDLDDASDVVVKVRAAMAGAADAPVLALDSYFNEGDTKVEDSTAAVTGTAYAEYTATIAAADVPAGARTLSVEITPAAHATDALYVTSIWVEYTRK